MLLAEAPTEQVVAASLVESASASVYPLVAQAVLQVALVVLA